MHEICIDLQVNLTNQELAYLEQALPVGYSARTHPNDDKNALSNDVCVRKGDENVEFESSNIISIPIIHFLNGLQPIAGFLSTKNASLRLGLFYDLEQTVIFPVILTAECIHLMREFNLSLDATSYPCDNEESTNES